MNIFHLPDLGEGLAEAEIHEWHVKVGDVVKVDQPLVTMETAKAVVEVPSPQSGKIVKLYGSNGEVIKTHAALVEFETESVTAKDNGTVVGSLEVSSMVLDEGDMIIGSANTVTSTVKAMPAVRSLAKQLGIDINTVKASGTQGQITADDVKNHVSKNVSAGLKNKMSGDVSTLQGVRRAMALVMTQSHQEVVPVTIIDDADITNLANSDITACIINAIVAGVKAEPALNAWYDGKTMERCLMSEVNLGLAVDTEEGLFVPVLKNVTSKTSEELRSMINTFKTTVKSRTISPSDLQGASITLSNFGMIAGRYATPIIVPPMVAILGCGRLREEPRIVNGNIVARKILPLSLSFDHRAVTGGEATRFLAAVISKLES